MTYYSPLPRYNYPIGVVICAVLLLGNLLYSIVFIAKSRSVIKIFNLGKTEYNNKNYDKSIKLFQSVLETAPNAEQAKIAMIKSYFAIGKKHSCEIAIEYLKNIELREYQWNEINDIVPVQCKKYLVNLVNKEKNK
ncbi:outer membrane protein assembly factor BamD [Rickettsia endosymbiont of Cardiosporidium cionae]|uniref:hypothetical protein n=1 Tax=Rickettsia endosymbiont of Cardiosporidium cionae TaxID=2777155 RepID=UPI00189458F3|nr:hypothetical protein [Rickettsia endosymbiont of Cardiosporidium cionae]KAF8818775.1 hypothetical protein IHI24_000009 [Rickettsia endosymbiont of Cardiosporidium cionae]